MTPADQARYNELIDKWFDPKSAPLTHEEINELDSLAVMKTLAIVASEAASSPAPRGP